MNIYTDNGYENRKEYLLQLADELGIDSGAVFAAAEILGPSEDFDGLVTTLEDFYL